MNTKGRSRFESRHGGQSTHAERLTAPYISHGIGKRVLPGTVLYRHNETGDIWSLVKEYGIARVLRCDNVTICVGRHEAAEQFTLVEYPRTIECGCQSCRCPSRVPSAADICALCGRGIHRGRQR